MKAILNGVTIAQTNETLLIEGNHYFPADSVDSDAKHLFGAICHYCGHFLDSDAILALRNEAATAQAQRIKLV